jgi:hypothetical protein
MGVFKGLGSDEMEVGVEGKFKASLHEDHAT